MAEHVMVNPLQMKDNVGERRGQKRETRGLGGTHDQMEVCLDENGFLRSGQFKCLELYQLPYIREYSAPSNNPLTLILGEEILKNYKNGFN